MSRCRVGSSGLVCLLLSGLWGVAFGGELGIAVDRNTIDRFDATKIQMVIFGLTGPEAHVRLVVDVDGDGLMDLEDYSVWSTVIVDNVPPWTPNMPKDSDPVGGLILSRLRLFGPLGFPLTAGSYIWQAEDPGINSVTTTFTVTATSEVETVSGQVIETGSGTPIPGALVSVLPVSEDCADMELSAFADAAGNFTIDVPPGIACRYRLALAAKPGYLTELATLPSFILEGSPISGLTVELSPGTHSATGTLAYSSGPRTGLGIPGQLIVAELDSIAPTVAIGYTNPDGTFEVTVNDGDWVASIDSDLQLALAGAVGRNDARSPFTASGGPVAIAALDVPATNAFIRGTLRDELLSPVAGRIVESSTCDPECHSTSIVTANDGSFALGVLAPAEPDAATWTSRPMVPLDDLIAQQSVLDLTAGDDLLGNDIDHLEPTHFITGQFTDSAGDPIGDLCIWGETFGPENYIARGRVGCDGNYSIPVVDGTWEVSYEEGLASLVRNLDPAGFHQQVTIAGSDQQLDVIVGPSPFFPAIVRVFPGAAAAGEHVIVEGINFSATGATPVVTVNGVAATVVDARPDIGRLAFAMPAGAPDGPVQVQVEEGGTSRVSNAVCMEKLTGSFESFCSIVGNVTVNQGAKPLEGTTVIAIDETTDRLARVAVSDSNGDYGMDLNNDLAKYTLLFIPPAHSFRVWAEQEAVSCPSVADQNIRSGRALTGRVIGGDGQGIANVFVDASGLLSEASVLTGFDGSFGMRLFEDDTVDVRFFAPIGSRLVNDQSAQVVMTAAIELPDVTLSTGYLFAGRIADANDAGLSADIDADGVDTGMPSGRTVSDACDGSFGLALAPGQHGLRIEVPDDSSYDGPTEVEWLTLDGDASAEFDFTLFDNAALQQTGPEPRINDQSDFSGQAGQPYLLGVENLGSTSVDVVFPSALSGSGTGWDPGRGIVLTRVPGGASSGDLRVDVDGTPSAPIPFTLDPGVYDPGPFTIAGNITDGGSPVAGALVLLFTPDATDASCDDDVNFHEYDVTDAGGAYSLDHPGGQVFVLVMPDSAGVLALSVQEFPNETGDRLDNDIALGAGAALTLRVVSGTPAVPVPNAVVSAEGGFVDLRMTDTNGEATFHLPAGPVDLEFSGPLGSRLLESELSTLAPGTLGDVPLGMGPLVTGRVAEDDGSPTGTGLTGLEANGFSVSADQDYFFALTRQSGVWRGPVGSNDPFAVNVQSGRDDLADLNVQHDAIAGDLIHYPTEFLDPAGTISGTVFDAETSTPLPGLSVASFFDDGGTPGGFSGGGRTCDDGTYRLKVTGGTHFVAAFPGFDFPDLLEGYYSPSATGDSCPADAESVAVGEGTDTPGVDVAVDVRSVISGTVAVFDTGEPNVQVTASLGRLGTCQTTTLTGPDGLYAVEVPAAAGYRLESEAPASVGGPPQCFAGQNGCPTFDPVTAEPLLATTGINFLFGFAPPEVSGTVPLLTVARDGSADVVVTFEQLPPEDHADAYNIYSGSLGDFGNAATSDCLQVPGALVDNLDGTFSKTLASPAGGWYLVSASNVIAEGSLGSGRVLSNDCGAVPPPSKSGAPVAIPLREPKQAPAQREHRSRSLRRMGRDRR